MGDLSRERVRAALAVLRRGSTSGTAGNVAYVVYVVAIFALVYGFPYGRTIFAALGSERLAALASDPVSLVLVAVAYGALLVLTARGGRLSGPVAPPPVWTRHVLSAPIDRAVALRRWWWVSLGGLLGVGMVLGIVLGLSLWSAGVTGAEGVVLGLVALAIAALGLALVWLRAQVAPEPPLPGGRSWTPSGMLRRLSTDRLLAQAQRRVLVAGGVVLGQVQVVRDQVSAGSLPSGGARLRPGRWLLLRRDLLGLRRSGRGQVAPLLACGGGAWVLVQGVADANPWVAVAGALTMHAGVAGWSPALRQQAAVSGLPPLLGWSPVAEATRHLLLPALAAGVVATVVGAASLPTLAGPSWSVLAPFALLPVSLGAATWSAFRPDPQVHFLLPQTAVPLLVLWWCTPAMLVAAVVATPWWRWGGGPLGLGMTALAGCLALASALARVHATSRPPHG